MVNKNEMLHIQADRHNLFVSLFNFGPSELLNFMQLIHYIEARYKFSLISLFARQYAKQVSLKTCAKLQNMQGLTSLRSKVCVECLH